MANNRVNMKNFEERMAKILKDVESPESLREVGEEMAERIRKRTRLGKGVSQQGGPAVPLKPLAKSTKDGRAGKVAFATSPQGHVYPYKPESKPRLHPQTSAGRSNLTRTGDLLNSIVVLSVKLGSVILGFKGERNKEVAGYVAKDRPFFNLSGAELNGLARLFRQRIEKALRRRA